MAKTKAEEESLQQRFADFSSDSTLHGLRNVGETRFHAVRRLIWLTLVLLMLAILLYFFINGLRMYFSYPTSTKLNVYENASLVYPAVTICNNNQLRSEYLRNNSLLDEFFGSIAAIFPQSSSLNLSNQDTLEALDKYSMFDVYTEGSHQIEEMFSFCMWNNVFFNCSDQFTSVLTERYGRCYTFNMNGSYMSENSGELYGLAVALYVGQDNYDHTATSPGAGLFVHLHRPGSYPLFTSGVTSLPPGVTTDLKMNRKKDTLLPLPYEGPGCHSGDDYDNLEDCKFRCRLIFGERGCNCTILPDLGLTNFDHCTLRDFVTCVNVKNAEYWADRSSQESCDCMHHCEEVTYAVTQSSLLFPSMYATQYYNKFLGIQFSDDVYRSNSVYIKLYYENLITTVTEQVATYTSATFFAEIGGYMGLFLGASLLTISELLEFVGSLIYSMFHRTNRIEDEKDPYLNKYEKNQKMMKTASHY